MPGYLLCASVSNLNIYIYIYYCFICFLFFGNGFRDHLLVNNKSNQAASTNAEQNWKWERGCRKTQADAADEDDRLQSLPENGDERENKHGVFFAPSFESIAGAAYFGAVLGLDGLCDFHTPFVFELGHSQECSTHQRDDEGGH